MTHSSREDKAPSSGVKNWLNPEQIESIRKKLDAIHLTMKSYGLTKPYSTTVNTVRGGIDTNFLEYVKSNNGFLKEFLAKLQGVSLEDFIRSKAKGTSYLEIDGIMICSDTQLAEAIFRIKEILKLAYQIEPFDKDTALLSDFVEVIGFFHAIQSQFKSAAFVEASVLSEYENAILQQEAEAKKFAQKSEELANEYKNTFLKYQADFEESKKSLADNKNEIERLENEVKKIESLRLAEQHRYTDEKKSLDQALEKEREKTKDLSIEGSRNISDLQTEINYLKEQVDAERKQGNEYKNIYYDLREAERSPAWLHSLGAQATGSKWRWQALIGGAVMGLGLMAGFPFSLAIIAVGLGIVAWSLYQAKEERKLGEYIRQIQLTEAAADNFDEAHPLPQKSKGLQADLKEDEKPSMVRKAPSVAVSQAQGLSSIFKPAGSIISSSDPKLPPGSRRNFDRKG
jgi:archaellum component FlaC